MSRMRFAVILSVVLLAAPALAGPESLAGWQKAPLEKGVHTRAVVDSFPSPGLAPMGLDWVESLRGTIYHVDEGSGNVYAITPEGTDELLFNVGVQIGAGQIAGIGNGICHVYEPGEGHCLYIADYNGHEDPFIDMVYKFALDGTLLGSWEVQEICDQVLGICFDGTYFYLSCLASTDIVRCDTSFAEVDRHDAPSGASGGALDYDPVLDCYYMTNYYYGMIYILDAALDEDGSIQGPATQSAGLTIGRTTRGRTLWFGSVANQTIYELTDGYYNDPVERTTWGSLKQMHRDQ